MRIKTILVAIDVLSQPMFSRANMILQHPEKSLLLLRRQNFLFLENVQDGFFLNLRLEAVDLLDQLADGGHIGRFLFHLIDESFFLLLHLVPDVLYFSVVGNHEVLQAILLCPTQA